MIYIGLDIGSTAVKALAVNEKGETLARGSQAYPTHTEGVCATHDALDWWESAASAVRQVVEKLGSDKDIVAISTSSQGGSILAVDKNYKPLCEALTWMDRRAVAEADELAAHFGDEVYRMCGWRTAPTDCAAKLLWLKRNQPEVFNGAAYFLTTEEYVNYRLVGKAITDATGAAMTRLFNINTRSWDKRMLDYVGITEAQLPEVHPCGELLGTLTAEAAKDMCLSTDVKVYNGAHDQYCASIGSGVTDPGELLLATGTAWVIFGVTESLCFNERYTAPGVHPIEGRCGVMTSLAGIGAAVENYANSIGESLKHIDEVAAGRREAASEVLACPCPPGKNFIPHLDRAFEGPCGMTEKNDKFDVALAMMECAAFEVKLAMEEYKRQGIIPEKVVLTMSGGAARSKLWSSLIAYICDTPVMLTHQHDTPTLGASMIAATYSGAFDSLTACGEVFVGRVPLSLDEGAEEIKAYYAEKLEKYRRFAIA